MNCLAFMPSLAASFGLVCGGGLIRAKAYEIVGGLSWVGANMEEVLETSSVAACLK